MSNYNKYPNLKIEGHRCYSGYNDIATELKKNITKDNFILVFDTYPGVNDQEVLSGLRSLDFDNLILSKSIYKQEENLNEQLKYHLTENRVFGRMYFGELSDFIVKEKLERIWCDVKKLKGLTIIYGVGASLISEGDLIVYLDMSRWEIQLRYRKGMPNFNCSNHQEDILKKYKRAYFIEWRVADKHKSKILSKSSYILDTNREGHPKMITKKAFDDALNKLSSQPFRTVPYFDPSVWGGQWMKTVCNLDSSKDNFGWAFDGVPEENSLLLDFNGINIEIPAMDLVLEKPVELLGPKVYSRFGAEFPIRFDFLDTMDGQNLSFQVHPTTEYIKKEFGMSYTQDESYYILDAKKDASVYLGLRDDVSKKEMICDLKDAEKGKIIFDTEKYVNKFHAKKHDHFLIPAGTCHCSGANTMVLEISATPYIFTFKLWDWGRLGRDGKPRPININHGETVINLNYSGSWIRDNLVNNIQVLEEKKDYREERTGLHELEFIETRRYFFTDITRHDTCNNLNMINLVEGKEAIIESPEDLFPPFIIHYAETVIIPAGVNKYTIRPHGDSVGEKLILIKAFVRT